MIHYGDITKIKGDSVPIVDIITGGSPCQDLSVAGKRAGLAGERSGLFMEQIRIIKEMREYDRRHNGRTDFSIRPRWMVWENVPGAFSSNGGEDFRAVLEETAKVAERDARIPRLEGGYDGHRQDVSWEQGGLLLGVYMMHSFGEYPREENESRLSQILEEKPLLKYCLSARACQGILNRAAKRGKELPEMLRIALERQSVSSNVQDVRGGVKESSSSTNESQPSQHSTTSQCYGISAYESNAMKSPNPHSGIYEADTSRTLSINGGNPACNQGGICVLEGNGQRESHKGDGYAESETMYTLNTIERHAVCCSQDAYDKYTENDVSATIKQSGGIYGGGQSH